MIKLSFNKGPLLRLYAISLFFLLVNAKTYSSQTLNQKYQSLKQSIRKKNQTITSEELARHFTNTLVNKIIPYWYKTPWTFEGHSEVPRQGSIACGYFISTTLRDIGLNLNRYELAKQNPYNEALSLNLGNKPWLLTNSSTLEAIKEIKRKLKDGIYFIGFDQSHVGYLLKKNEQVFLIHSNYIEGQGVMKEAIEKSEVFSSYKKFHISGLSTNKNFLKKWIRGERIKVYK